MSETKGGINQVWKHGLRLSPGGAITFEWDPFDEEHVHSGHVWMSTVSTDGIGVTSEGSVVVSLDQYQINELIRRLRHMRDEAFGPNE